MVKIQQQPAPAQGVEEPQVAGYIIEDYFLDSSGQKGWCTFSHPFLPSKSTTWFPIRDLVMTACARLWVVYDDISNQEVTYTAGRYPHERVCHEPVLDWYHAYVTDLDYLALLQQEALQGAEWEWEEIIEIDENL